MITRDHNITLGTTDITVSPLGIGTWAWGDRIVWSYGKGYTERDVRGAYLASLKNGINFFDTAEIYGWGVSEQLIGSFIRETDSIPIIATKYFPYPWRLTKGSLRKALLQSLQRLGRESVELYQIHWPLHNRPLRLLMDALADVYDDGLIKAVGVSNYSPTQMCRAQDALAKRNIPLASNQVEYSLLHRKPDRNGLRSLCREREITLIAYSPLAMGMLAGAYTLSHPPVDGRRFRYKQKMYSKIHRLVETLREIGSGYDKTPAQTALNWVMMKGTVPIPGAKNAQQAEANAGALGWMLTAEEIEVLDKRSEEVQ